MPIKKWGWTVALLFIFSFPNLAWATNYEVDFKLNTAASYEAVQFKVTYTAAAGQFAGSGGSVSCTPNSSLSMMSAFNDDDFSTKVLNAGFASTAGMSGPVVLCTCIYTGTSAPSANQFTIAVTSWEPGSVPSVIVSRIQ